MLDILPQFFKKWVYEIFVKNFKIFNKKMGRLNPQRVMIAEFWNDK